MILYDRPWLNQLPGKKIPSPDRRHEALLTPFGGGSWDTLHASLALGGLTFGNRMFGWHGVWSSCSCYFAIMEWCREVDAEIHPDMQLIIVDVREGRECVVERVENGFIEPMFFHDQMIKYNLFTKRLNARRVSHRPIKEISDWRMVSDKAPDADSASAEAR
jgi:hypothetical protein